MVSARCSARNATSDGRVRRIKAPPLQGWVVETKDDERLVVGPLPCKTGSTTARDFAHDRGGTEIKGSAAFGATLARGAKFFSSARRQGHARVLHPNLNGLR